MNTEDEEAALLAAVYADLDDDTVRLVYADWLDEQPHRAPCPDCGGGRSGAWHFEIDADGRCVRCGRRGCNGDGLVEDHSRAERAEFIRLQIELERLTRSRTCPACPNTSCPFCNTTRRIDALMAKNRFTWETGGNGRVLASVIVRWRRGFVYSLECRSAVFEENDYAKPRAWLVRWPTVQKIYQPDCVPNESSGSTPGPLADHDSYDWWLAPDAGPDTSDDVRGGLFNQLAVDYPDHARYEHFRPMVEFASAEEAVDRLATSAANLIRPMVHKDRKDT